MQRIFAMAVLLIAAVNPASAAGYTKNVAIVIYDGVELLDFAGPAEVFSAASHGGMNGKERPFNVYTVSKTRTPIVSQGFVDVTPDYSIADSPHPDILVLPGGSSDSVTSDAEWMAWVKKSAGNAENVLTVCTGAFIIGKLGMLDGLDATTWYAAVPALTEQFPKARVQPGRRFIDNGKVITTAGVSAGIDGSLHVVARSLGRYVADRTAEYMEYAWTPQAYTSSKYPQLNPRLDAHGRALQEAAIAAQGGDTDRAVTLYRNLTERDRTDVAAWMSLGQLLFESKRYDEAAAAFNEATSDPGRKAEAYYNEACAWALAGETEKAIDAVERAIEAGFRRKSVYLGDPDLAAIRADARFQRLIASL